MTTFTQLIDRTTLRMSMVSAAGVQVYAEDRVAEMIQHKFDILWDDFWWPAYNKWGTWTLNEADGIVTTDLTELVKRFEDIRIIYRGDTQQEVILLPMNFNPNTMSGTTAQYYEANSDTSRVFTIWPKTATGTLDVNYRTKPDPFTDEDVVLMDEQVLILGAAWDYLEDDGTNPNATQKFQTLFNQRLKQLRGLIEKRPIPLDPHSHRPESFTFVPS